LILGFMLPAITSEFGLSSSQSGSLVTWTLIGAVLGGVIFGPISDRFGRCCVCFLSMLCGHFYTSVKKK
ncbi:MFS transporter, partial [Gelidibacter salicanalis]